MAAGHAMLGLTKKPATKALENLPTGEQGGDTKNKDLILLGDKPKNVNEGGQREVVINIAKQIERLEVHVMNAKEGAEEIASLVREELRRVYYSLNGQTTN